MFSTATTALFVLALSFVSKAALVLRQADNDVLSITLSNVNGNSVKSVDDLVISASVTNIGGEPLKVASIAGILDGKATQSFRVKKGDKDVQFLGAIVQSSIGPSDDKFYTTLAPKETVVVEHKLAGLYDFATAGTGDFTFEPLAAIASKDEKTPLILLKPSTQLTVSVTDDVSARVLEPEPEPGALDEGPIEDPGAKEDDLETRGIEKRAINVCRNLFRRPFITASYIEAKHLARVAARHILFNGNDAVFTAYYKTNPTNTIRDNFVAVRDEFSLLRTLGCTDPLGLCGGGSGTIAYTVIATTNIYYCDIFFDELPSFRLCLDVNVNDRNIRGGTTLHELAHATSISANPGVPANWIIDFNYGCPGNQALSASDQAHNADNYNCFATQVYQDEGCPLI